MQKIHRMKQAQSGYALLIMMVLVAMGVLYAVVNGASLVGMKANNAKDTRAALLQAKEALIGYAATYHDMHDGEGFGHLPCPDTNGDGITDLSCSVSAAGSVVGLLPYKTLDLPDLRDSSGTCLWYVVSGNYKYNPKAPPLNWDSQGRISVVDGNNNPITAPNDVNGGAAAVVIAAGPPLSGQNRTPNNAQLCGVMPAEVSRYIESAISDSGVSVLVDGETKDASGNIDRNDQILAITPKEIFSRIVPRGDTPSFINAGIQAIKARLDNALTAYPAEAGNNLPDDNPFTGGTTANNFYDDWKNNFRYLTCPSGTYCYEIQTQLCDGALVFSGQSTSGNPRLSTATLPDYLEDIPPANALSLVNGATYEYSGGPAAYLDTSRSADVVECLSAQPTSMRTVSFAANLGQFTQTESQSNMVRPSIANNRVRLGVNASSTIGFGCFWYPAVFPFRNGGRFYFQFRLPSLSPATNVGSFTFSIADAATNLTPTNMCGNGGQYLGFAGSTSGAAPVNYPKLGIEFDKISNPGRNDPAGDHVAFIYWGNSLDNLLTPPTLDDDNQHGAGGVTNPLNPASAPGMLQRSILTGGTIYNVRLDIARVYDASIHEGTYTLKAYITGTSPLSCPIANFSTMNDDLANLCPTLDNSQLSYGYLEDTIPISDVDGRVALRQVYLGFTTGQEGPNQRVDITNFSAVAR